MANEAEKALHEMQQVLTIDANGAYETEEDKAELLWHELQNVYRSKRILSGVLLATKSLENNNTLSFPATLPVLVTSTVNISSSSALKVGLFTFKLLYS